MCIYDIIILYLIIGNVYCDFVDIYDFQLVSCILTQQTFITHTFVYTIVITIIYHYSDVNDAEILMPSRDFWFFYAESRLSFSVKNEPESRL